jgi:Putative endonuclease, protein of unknown function (DUF1780)
VVNKRDSEHLKLLSERAEDTVDFFSNNNKPERERSACAAFLRALGVDFSVADLGSVSIGQDPPDVICHTARFEVCEPLDEGRRQHDEVRSRLSA